MITEADREELDRLSLELDEALPPLPSHHTNNFLEHDLQLVVPKGYTLGFEISTNFVGPVQPIARVFIEGTNVVVAIDRNPSTISQRLKTWNECHQSRNGN